MGGLENTLLPLRGLQALPPADGVHSARLPALPGLNSKKFGGEFIQRVFRASYPESFGSNRVELDQRVL